jgi:hypothetical protein
MSKYSGTNLSTGDESLIAGEAGEADPEKDTENDIENDSGHDEGVDEDDDDDDGEDKEEEEEDELPEDISCQHINSLLDRTDQFALALRRAAAARYSNTTSAGTAQQDEYQLQQVLNSAEKLEQTSKRERVRRGLNTSDSTALSSAGADSCESDSDDEVEGMDVVTGREKSVNGVILLTNLLCTSLRHVRDTLTRETAVVLLRELALLGDDEVRLERVVPFIVSLLVDDAPTVRCLALRTLVTLLDRVNDFPASDSRIFPEYILPALGRFPSDGSELVRLTFTECIGKFAEISRRFLEIAHSKVQANAVEFARLKHKGTTAGVARKMSTASGRRATIEPVQVDGDEAVVGIGSEQDASRRASETSSWNDDTDAARVRGYLYFEFCFQFSVS